MKVKYLSKQEVEEIEKENKEVQEKQIALRAFLDQYKTKKIYMCQVCKKKYLLMDNSLSDRVCPRCRGGYITSINIQLPTEEEIIDHNQNYPEDPPIFDVELNMKEGDEKRIDNYLKIISEDNAYHIQFRVLGKDRVMIYSTNLMKFNRKKRDYND